jgi:hypothetical protein
MPPEVRAEWMKRFRGLSRADRDTFVKDFKSKMPAPKQKVEYDVPGLMTQTQQHRKYTTAQTPPLPRLFLRKSSLLREREQQDTYKNK